MSILPQPLTATIAGASGGGLLSGPLGGIAAGISGVGAGLNTAGFILAGLGGAQSPGDTVGQFPVSLGNFIMKGFEVPDGAPWGGAQALTIHKLVGGARVIDAMGPDDIAIKFKGVFLSADADTRALQVDKMRKAGLPVAWFFANHITTVVIRSFHPVFKRPDHCTYDIELEVVRDLTQPSTNPPISPSVSFLSSLLSMLNTATALVSSLLSIAAMTFATVDAAFSSVSTSITVAESFSNAAALGVPSAIAQQQAAIAAMIGSVAGGISGPVSDAIATPLDAAGSLEAANADQLALMLAPLVAAQAMMEEALVYSESYLAAVPVFGGVAPGASPLVAAANLTTSAALMLAEAQMMQIQAELINMQRLIETTGT